jgi:dihydrofolate reductase
MGKIIVIQFITLDGVVEDPDGRGGKSFGGWAFRLGPEAVAGDKFRLGPILETGVLLFGRRTWEQFSQLWPKRTDEFSTAMNTVPKLVATHRGVDTTAWSNSTILDGELSQTVPVRAADQDVVVVGSLSVAQALAEKRLVDEYRLIIFPTAVGNGQRLFRGPVDLTLEQVTQVGGATLAIYRSQGRVG